jgi:hypothetical protein
MGILSIPQPTYNFEYLLLNWDESVPAFYAYMTECCGVDPASYEYEMVKSLVATQSDLERFVDLYDGDYNNIPKTVQLMLE